MALRPNPLPDNELAKLFRRAEVAGWGEVLVSAVDLAERVAGPEDDILDHLQDAGATMIRAMLTGDEIISDPCQPQNRVVTILYRLPRSETP